ncbi:MAG: DUF3108 domain-containing protein [Candidatus Binatia bacterium]
MRAALALGVLLLSACPPARAAAAPRGVALDYEVRYGPFEVLEVSAITRLDGDRYETSSALRTVGIIGLLFPWSATAATDGRRAGGALRPVRHRSEGTYRESRRTVELDYDETGGVQSRIVPPSDAENRDTVPADMLPGTIDPLTASLAAIERECRGTLNVFDGRRRYDMALEERGLAPVPSDRAVYQGDARHCRANIAPLAGFWRPSARQDERPTHLDVWIAPPRPGLLAVPVYLELSSPRGTLGVHLVRAEPLP